jgi:hypothetical protein
MKWQGRMYDISKVEIKNKTAFIYCVHDKKEDSIIRLISGLMEKENQSKAPLKIFSFLCDTLIRALEINFYSSSENLFSHFIFPETLLLNKQESPPPKV